MEASSQVSWLGDLPSSAPSHPVGQWLYADSVLPYSCGAAPDFNRLPFSWKRINESGL
jgi:hypothetical protein